jgi:hypothetical protein
MNTTVMNDIDPTPDRIAARLAGDSLKVWIVDEQGIEDRNAIIACVPERLLHARSALRRLTSHTQERWSVRRGRLPSREPLPLDR